MAGSDAPVALCKPAFGAGFRIQTLVQARGLSSARLTWFENCEDQCVEQAGVDEFYDLAQQVTIPQNVRHLDLNIDAMSIGEWESRKNESTSSNLQTLQLNHLSEDMVYAVLQLAPRLLVLLLQDVRVCDNQSVAVSETSLTLSRLRRLIIKANPYINNARNVMLPLFDIVVRRCAMSLRSLSLPVHCTGVIAQLAVHTDDLQIKHLELTVPTNSDWFDPSFGMMVPAKENKENIVNARRILSACPRLRHLQLTDFNFDDYPEILDGVSAPLSSFCSRACDRDGEAWQLAKYINEPLPALRQLRHTAIDVGRGGYYFDQLHRSLQGTRVMHVPCDYATCRYTL